MPSCTAYCVKCRRKVTVGQAREAKSGGTTMLKGPCPRCATTCCRIVGRSGGARKKSKRRKSRRKSARK